MSLRLLSRSFIGLLMAAFLSAPATMADEIPVDSAVIESDDDSTPVDSAAPPRDMIHSIEVRAHSELTQVADDSNGESLRERTALAL